MKTPACLPTLVPAVALALGLMALLPAAASAAEPVGPGPSSIPSAAGVRSDPGWVTPQPQGTPSNENNRANYFVDYHATTAGPATQGVEGVQDSPANLHDSINRRDVGAPSRSPIELELSRFRGEMSNWRR
jgi:hypothetical protein